MTGRSIGQTGARQVIEPYTMREDFQGDSLGQWASYPPAQDVGYEPSLSPTTEFGAPGGRSLMRVIKPNRSGGQRFGFIKKVRMTVGNDSRVRFSYRLNSPTTEPTIEIGLAGIDGRPYTTKLKARTNEWSVADLPLSDFRAPTGVAVEAMYIVATIPQVDADITYRFMIDDITISAAREAHFEVRNPRAEIIEPWPELISEKSYRAGETFAVEASAPVRVTKVDCILETSAALVVTSGKLYDDGSHGDKSGGDGIWSNGALYSFRPSDPKGMWLVHFRGTTAEGKSINTSVRVIVRPQRAGSHPSLFFEAADRERLIERSLNPKLSSLWTFLQTSAKTARESGEIAQGRDVFELLDTEYLLPSLLGYFDVLNRARSRIASNAFEAYITGSEQARRTAKAALLDVARWKRWEPPWFTAHGQHTYYPAGLLAADVALGYDLLYDDLSEPERALVRRALLEKSIIPTFKEYVADNRVMANTSNWIAHTVGGALIAAASISDDLGQQETDGHFEFCVGGLLRKLEDHIKASYLEDGSYGEGISYQEFDLETLAPALVAVRRAYGSDYFKQTRILDSLTYPLYTLAWPTSASLDMGDTHPPAGHGIPALVYQSRDPVVRWYYSQFDRPSLSKFIFFDDSVAPEPPTLPTSRVFAQRGNAVFRTGWAADDTVFLFRAGPNFNHHHADQGSFLLTAFGEPLITEAGWSDYYKDPYYATFFTQAVGHNTILVDGNPESQTIADTLQFKALDSYPRIKDSITSEFYDGVGSELSAVYKGSLARYVRSIVFVKPHYFVIFDDLKVSARPAQFDFLLHLPNRDKITIEGLTAIYKGAKASLAVRSFPPKGAKLSIENGHIPYPVFATRTPAETPLQPAYLSVKTVEPMSAAQFVTAMAAAKSESAAQKVINQMTEIAGENLKGIRVERASEIDLVMFRSGAETQTIHHGEWVANAATLAITQSGNKLEIFAVQNARSLRRGNQILFSSQSPMSVAVNFNATGIEVACNSEAAAKFTLFVGKDPDRVLLDGKDLNATDFSFNRSEGTISLNVPSSQHDLKILFR